MHLFTHFCMLKSRRKAILLMKYMNYKLDHHILAGTSLKILAPSLQDLADSMDEGDVVKFTDALQEYDSMTRLVCFLPFDIDSMQCT